MEYQWLDLPFCPEQLQNWTEYMRREKRHDSLISLVPNLLPGEDFQVSLMNRVIVTGICFSSVHPVFLVTKLALFKVSPCKWPLFPNSWASKSGHRDIHGSYWVRLLRNFLKGEVTWLRRTSFCPSSFFLFLSKIWMWWLELEQPTCDSEDGSHTQRMKKQKNKPYNRLLPFLF